MKGVGGLATVARGIGQRADDLGELENGAGPPVRQRQRHGRGHGRSLVDEVDLEPVDVRRVLRQLIEAPLLGPPVEAGLPVGDELFQVRQVRAVVPPRSGDLVREARHREARLEIREHRVGHADGVGRDGRALHGRLSVRASSEQQDECQWQRSLHRRISICRKDRGSIAAPGARSPKPADSSTWP